MNLQCFLVLAVSFTVVVAHDGLTARADVPLYGQCGGIGYTGSTTCAQGVCTYSNPYYSQCILGSGTTTPPASTPTTTTKTTAPTSTPTSTGNLPSSFSWSSTGPLISPKADSRNIAGIKDPSIVQYNGVYHVFASTASDAGYSLVYLNFTDFSQAASANQFYLDQSGIGTGYRAAPEIFYFAPQSTWYLIFQNGNSAYSTNPDISNPQGWSAPKTFYSAMPATISNNIGNGYWVDMWVICDSDNCHLFSSDDNGHLYRSQTSLADFPNGMTEPVIAMQDSNPYNLYEASNVYNYGAGYLLIVEAIGSDGHRFFRSWTSSSISGPWTGLADTEANPFARASNVVFSGTAWTQDISHGEMIRSSHDQTLTISPCNIRYLYQGQVPGSTADYNALPWRLALLTQTNSAC
ncbi:glycosyl hydrolase family 62 protein [Pholiota conissans]|uniref:Alpha-L-arabinofuranosidase n=1 Tax=Pholiota conissans TaxID=109636 RepID=A0A9P6CXW8_9AGAR|nr:glycosyl hydrolase family 62 protein [Pholiota conissans]